MHLRVAGFLFFCVVIWHWCNGQKIPEELQKDNITPPNMFGRESPTNKTMDQLIMEAMGGLQGALSLKTINGGILMELDMLLSKQQYYNLYEQPNSSTLIRSKRKAIRDPIYRWTNGEIPYRFYPGHFNQRDQYMVRQAMTEWERYTCLRFKEATSSDINVIVFRNSEGCYSQLGMVGGQQVVSLSLAGCRYTGLYLHEIGHAIGLVHEHQLPNRDDYVEILTDNVQPDLLDQFTKYTSQAVDQMNVPYEYSSVMHYGVTAFSKGGGLKTIRVKYPEKEASIGEVYMKELSFTDVEIVNKMYKCPAKCDPSIQCSGGYIDENCRCVCKDGSQDCQIGGGIQPSGTCGVNTYGDSWKCFVWAQHGQCESNPSFMTKSCAKACGPCVLKRKPGTCAKMYPSDKCLKWANRGDCLTNTEWMSNYCCGTCTNSSTGTGCQNKHSNSIECDRWAVEGECEANPLWMIPNCQKSCRACDKPIPTQEPATTPAPDIGNCTDKHDAFQCQSWARAGECDKNPTWMVPNCQRACGKCSLSGCINLYDDFECDIWAASRECDKNPGWMLVNCRKSCGQCNNNTTNTSTTKSSASTTALPSTTRNSTQTVCTNKYQDNKLCDTWAKAGQCNANTWMIQNCARSCDRCSGTETTTPRPITKLTTQKSIGECKNLLSDSRSCDAWAKSGYCKTNQYVTINCAKSCGNCSDQGLSTSSNVRFANNIVKTTNEKPLISKVNEEAPADDPTGGCRDEKDTCVTWARYGFCDNNRDQAVRLCPKTCNLCVQRQGLLLR